MLLEIKDLEAKVAETGNQILRGVTLTIREGEVILWPHPAVFSDASLLCCMQLLHILEAL